MSEGPGGEAPLRAPVAQHYKRVKYTDPAQMVKAMIQDCSAHPPPWRALLEPVLPPFLGALIDCWHFRASLALGSHLSW